MAKDYVSELYQHADKNGWSVCWEVDSKGPEHRRTFFMRAVIDGKAYPWGKGKKKKEAKHKAAKIALLSKMDQNWDPKTKMTKRKASKRRCSCQQNIPVKRRREQTETNSRTSGEIHPSFKTPVDSMDAEDGRSPEESSQWSEETSQANSSVNKSDSIVSEDTSKSPETQTPVDSMEDEDGGSQWSEETSQPNSSVNKSDSIVFEDTSNSLKTQGARPAARPTRKTRQKPEDGKKGQNVKPKAAKRHSAEQQDAAKCKRKREASRFATEFDLIRFLGSGGFSVVYLAKHKRLNQNYVVKIALSDKDSLREVKALAELHHLHIVRYYSCWEEDEGYTWYERVGKYLPRGSVNYSTAKFIHIQMEVCAKTLSQWIKEKNDDRRLRDVKRAEECLPIFLQIVQGLEAIHLNKKIHRDLKPSNILLGKDGRMKIADFGLVTKNDDSERTRNRGTETYMAPEQKHGNYDHKVDMFPLGLIFLEMIYKISSGHERGKVLEEARNQKLPENGSLFKEFRLIRRLLSLDPKDRPEASEVGAEVEGWIQQELRGNVTV